MSSSIQNPKILICDDDELFHMTVKYAMKNRAECRSAKNPEEALAILKTYPAQVLLLDIQMRTPNEGLQFLPKFRELETDLAIVMSSSMTDFPTVREAMRLGADDYVPKDFDADVLYITIEQVLERRKLIRRKEQKEFEAEQVQKNHLLIGQSPSMQELRRLIDRIRNSHTNVVITGETGTGKEVVARQLRGYLSDGELAPFVAIDASTIQSSMAESLLFGHEKGAFTGADRTTKGIFEEANGGTVYIDEIANMPLDIQAKLLRVLQEKEIKRLGSSKVIALDFRVICATNQDLETLCKEGKFKSDLYQRLNVIPISIPPLRNRIEDIPLLVNHFIERYRGGKNKVSFTEEAMDTLKRYSWPGNIRELSNMVSYILTLSDQSEIDVSDLPPKIRSHQPPANLPFTEQMEQMRVTARDQTTLSFYDQISLHEREILKASYERNGSNASKTALELGMDRSHLYTKLKEHGLFTVKPKSS